MVLKLELRKKSFFSTVDFHMEFIYKTNKKEDPVVEGGGAPTSCCSAFYPK